MQKKVKIGDIATVITKGTTPTSIGYSFVEEGINFIKIESLNDQGGFITEKFAFINEECNDKMKRSQLQENDVLFSIAGAIGKKAIVTNDVLPANTNQALAIIRIPEGKINYRYLLYALESNGIKEQFEKQKQGVAQLNLSLKDVGELEITVVSDEEQNKIVDMIGTFDNLIEKRKQQHQKLDELVKARFVEMFGNPVFNTMRWETRTLKDVCIKLNDGTHFSPESFPSGEYKYITAKNIKLTGFDFSNITYVPAEVHKPIYERCNPEKGDVLYIKDGATTGIAIVNSLDEEFTLLSSVALLKQNRAIINGHFLAALLNNEDMYSNIRNNMGGAAITRLTIAKLNIIKIVVPPLELQNQFADFVQQINKSKLSVQKSLDRLETLKKVLMQKYFG